MTMSAPTPDRKRKMRARRACEPCRERKRKCDRQNPCDSCLRFQYSCYYVSVRGETATSITSPHNSNAGMENNPAQLAQSPALLEIGIPPSGSPPAKPIISESHNEHVQPSENIQLVSIEANSGAAFVRKLALALDPDNAPRLHLFAWNLFLGARNFGHVPQVRPIVELISSSTMERLATTYLSKVDPCYGFIDHDILQQQMKSRWLLGTHETSYDAVLCGVAALGLLYSQHHIENMELDLVGTAKHILEESTDARPNIDIVTGWVLRVAYLRITAAPHTAWLASCTLMHVLEASGIHLAQDSGRTTIAATELCSRITGIARHLNVWISFDLGRSRVILPQIGAIEVLPREGDYTVELLSLLPLSESLDPIKTLDLLSLKESLYGVLRQTHTEPPSVLAQCNLVLCIARRLRALDFNISGDLLNEVLALTFRSIHCAQIMLDTCNPWHHVANIPFQIVCILLAIDSAASLAQLGEAMKVLHNAAQIYNTNATKEALSTACLLALLHQKRKIADSKHLADIIETYSPSLFAEDVTGTNLRSDNTAMGAPGSTVWLDDLIMDLPNMQDFDVGQLLNENGQSDLSVQWY